MDTGPSRMLSTMFCIVDGHAVVDFAVLDGSPFRHAGDVRYTRQPDTNIPCRRRRRVRSVAWCRTG